MEEQEKQGQSKPVKTWFIERQNDNFIFATDEHDAWNLLTDKSQWRRHDFKIVGVSDGETYFSIMRNGRNEMGALLQDKSQIQEDMQKYIQTEDRLRFTELRGDDDEMVVKVKGLLQDLRTKLGEVDKKLANFNKTLVDKAFNAELDKARGNIEFPSNHDIMTPVQSDREKILANLKGI
jgi:hypothetical protein